MKMRTNQQGEKYLIYADDIELDTIALKLISLLPKHSGIHNKPFKMKLWDCAFDLIENTPKESIIFRRSLTIFNEKDEDRVYALLKTIIDDILKATGKDKEKSVKIDWNKERTRTNENNILIRYTADNKFVALKTITDVLIGTEKDINGLLKRVDRTIDTIKWHEFNRLVHAVKEDQSALGEDLIKYEFKSIRLAFEDLLTEKNIVTNSENVDIEKKIFKLNLGHNTDTNKKNIKNMEGTLDIFDF